jgi:16S rRNA (cytosine967-C5)-methyltransferase
VLDRGRDVQAGLDAVLRRRGLDAADASLASELVYGSLRLGLRLDWITSRFLRSPAATPRWLQRILRLAAYEVLRLDRVPAYASASWAVEAAKARGGKRLAGLANAVLRRVAELADAGVDPELFREDGCDDVRFLSRLHSCPEWIVRSWLADYGEEATEVLLRAQAAPPAVGVVLAPEHPDAGRLAEALENDPRLLARQGLGFALAPGPVPEALASADPAAWRRRSFAARQALLALDPAAWSGPVWDACAGQGGKTRVLVEEGAVPVLATDPHTGRLARLREWAEASGANVWCAAADARTPPPLAKAPGAVLLDVPCTGLGVLSRRPDIKWKRKAKDVKSLQRTQAAMLDNALAALPVGGSLAYLTCTLARRENEDAVERVLKRSPVREDVRFSTDGDAKLGEFFFASLLRRTG